MGGLLFFVAAARWRFLLPIRAVVASHTNSQIPMVHAVEGIHMIRRHAMCDFDVYSNSTKYLHRKAKHVPASAAAYCCAEFGVVLE